MTRILFYLDGFDHGIWQRAFKAALPEAAFLSYPNWGTPDGGPAYAFVWHPEPGLLARFPNIQAIFSLGAGVDHLTRDPDLPKHIPIVRMCDDGLREGMIEYMVMNTLFHHRDMIVLMNAQREGNWKRIFPRAAEDVRVGILGYGALGSACAEALLPFGYPVYAWSRTKKDSANGIKHFCGTEELRAFLEVSDILICLLPATPATNNLLNDETMRWLPEKAAIINGGRGNLIDLKALQTLLDEGHLSGATLDVFPEEPLPAHDTLWQHPKVVITPHIAAVTRPHTAAQYVAENIAKLEKGDAATNTLDIGQGY